MSEQLLLRFFGPPRLERDGTPVEVGRRKAIALLAYLAVTEQRHARDALAVLLWPEHDPANARGEVRRALSTLRKALGPAWLQADRESVALRQGAGLTVDVLHFRRLLRECGQHGHPAAEPCTACQQPLEEAVALAHSDLLKGFTLLDAPDFDDWQRFETDSLRRELASALERLARLFAWGAHATTNQAIRYARRWLALDPLDEAAHRLLMELYARNGERAAALQQYRECARLLKADLDEPPSAETEALRQRIRAGELAPLSLDAVSAPPGPPPRPSHNLPASLTPFVGREAELGEITSLLTTSSCRLLTLTGVGGIGKTRLALEAARQVATEAHFPHGVHFVDLAPVSAPTLVLSAVALALGLTLQGSADPRQQLLAFLHNKTMLLVVDNCEHLLDGVELFSEILQGAPALKLLATSRERLNLRGEALFPLDGLAVPLDERTEALELEPYSAVTLFVQSARRAARDFSLRHADRPHAIRVCQLVQGMPLGIELAATWVRTLSCREIADQVEQDLDFLSHSARDAPERHRSVRAIFEHSWRLLSEEERRALRRLAIFQGGFDREAADRVAGVALRLLASLVDKSLLRREATGRYGTHQIVRQFAAEKLAARPDEQAQLSHLHSAYFAGWLRQREPDLRGGGKQKETQDELLSELENLRPAWHWAIEQLDSASATTFLEGFYRLYEMRGWYREGEAAFDAAVRVLDAQASAAVPSSPLRAALLGKLRAKQAAFCFRLDRYDQAHALLDTALAALRGADQGDTADVAFCLHTLGNLAWMTGDFTRAKEQWQGSLAIRRALGDPVESSNTLNNLGVLATDLGELADAVRHFQEGLALKRSLGDQMGTANTLNNLGHLAMLMGDYERASRLLHESLATQKAAGTRLGMGQALFNLGWVAFKQGEYDEAEERLQESLRVSRELGNQGLAVYPLGDLGRVARARGNLAAARHYHHDAVRAAWEQGAIPALLHALVGAVEWLHAIGETEAAIELCACIQRQRATTYWNHTLLQTTLAHIASDLPSPRQRHERPADP